MNESMITKFRSVIDWYAKNNPEETRTLVEGGNKEQLATIQALVDKKLPDEFVALYSHFNGEEGPGMGIFLAHSFLSLEEIRHAIELSKTFVKPATRTIDNPQESDRLINGIIEQFKKGLPKDAPWYKFEFMCAPNTFSYPYVYPDINTTDRQKEMFSIDEEQQERMNELVTQLHELEKTSYNWDELHVTAFSDGDKNVRRADFSFIADIPFTSFPEGAIKKKYFNPYWIPVIFDNLGNYIGFDLDPDTNGKVGQIINFGRDEEDMFVIADTFEKFLDFNLSLIEKDPELFLGGKHIHDVYKGIILNL